MRQTHRFVVGAIVAVLLSGCTGVTLQPSDAQRTPSPVPPQPSGSSSTTAPVNSPTAPSSSSSTSTSGASEPLPTKPSMPLDDSTPILKAQRSDVVSEPSISASPGDITDKIAYDDGVMLHIDAIQFGKETKEGPGRFPGRAYAILSLTMANGSKQPIDLNSTVVTVLDVEDQQVAPVYVEDAEVADFSGMVLPGKNATARYAFAVGDESRSQVTVVVDFDGVHTSAVFRGELR